MATKPFLPPHLVANKNLSMRINEQKRDYIKERAKDLGFRGSSELIEYLLDKKLITPGTGLSMWVKEPFKNKRKEQLRLSDLILVDLPYYIFPLEGFKDIFSMSSEHIKIEGLPIQKDIQDWVDNNECNYMIKDTIFKAPKIDLTPFMSFSNQFQMNKS